MLRAGIVKESELRLILENTSDYIDSSKYFSWERYFTALITEKTKDSYLKYSKSELNSNYLQDSIQEKVLAEMKGIRFCEGKG